MKAKELVAIVSDQLGWGEVVDLETEDPSVRKIMRHTNLVLRSMQADRDWTELSSTTTIVTQAPVTESTIVLVNKGEDTIQVNPADMDVKDMLGCVVLVGSNTAAYMLVAVVGPNTFRLDRPWMNDSVSGITSVTVGRMMYSLPEDYDRANSTELRNEITGGTVSFDDERAVQYDRRGGVKKQAPTKACLEGLSPTGNRVITFNYMPDNAYIFEFSYQRNHPTLARNGDKVLYPESYSLAIADQITARLNSSDENQQKAIKDSGEALAERIRQNAKPEPGRARSRLSPYTGRRY